MERDGASNGNGDDSLKIGYQCDVYESCFSFDGCIDVVGSESIDGVDVLRGFNGFDGVDGGFAGVDGGFVGFDGSDGVDGAGFDGSEKGEN